MTHLCARTAGTLSLAFLIAGCATGETEIRDFATQDASEDTVVDAQADSPEDAIDAGLGDSDAPSPDGPDPLDASEEASEEAGEEAGDDASDGGDTDVSCPTGYTGAACDECADGYVACEGACIDDCESCDGKAFACDGACASDCKSCDGATVTCDGTCVADCSTCDGSEFDCNGACVPACGDCLNAKFSCDDQCVASCMSCVGKQATCETTGECLAACSACAGTCVQCPTGSHPCPGGCRVDVADVPSLGCMYTCDDQPCPVPANGQSTCTNGACDFTCDTASGFQKTGTECLCDAANGFVEHPTLHICVCESGMKGCGTFCASLTDPDHGCSNSFCTPCPSPVHAIATSCNAAGSCDFTCDSAAGYIKNTAGTGCVCPSFMVDDGTSCHCPTNQKKCGGTCVSTLTTVHGCAGASCDPCQLPPHAATTHCSGPGGTCGFTCDTGNGYVLNAAGDDCECGPTLIDYGTYCGCPGGEKICGGVCVSTTVPSTGCAGASCVPCPEPDHATSHCSGPGGTCGFTCDTAGHWMASGDQCVCDTGWKNCGGSSCVGITPANGCAGTTCEPCPLPSHASSTSCDGPGGTCSFTCDSTGHWTAIGNQCVCSSGWKDCGGPACEDATSPAHGCSGSSCTACPLPDHGTSTNCNGTGGTCDFVCDAGGQWVKSGNQCVCAPGYTDVGGVCVVACPGSTYGSSCYWYVASPSTWDAAQATCAATGGHLASVANSSENSFVRSLAASTFWIGLRDHSTIHQSVSADDCTDNVWLSGNGGTYVGSNNDWNDINPCGISSSADDIFGINITVPGMYVFATANSNFDTVLGLYTRINNTSGYTTCLGSSIVCDDDSGPGTRSLIVRYLNAGSYTVIMDGYSGSSGSYQLDVRRFDFVDGTQHGWANWASEEPNNAGSAEDCVEVNVSTGAWNDNQCGTSRPFVCERPL